MAVSYPVPASPGLIISAICIGILLALQLDGNAVVAMPLESNPVEIPIGRVAVVLKPCSLNDVTTLYPDTEQCGTCETAGDNVDETGWDFDCEIVSKMFIEDIHEKGWCLLTGAALGGITFPVVGLTDHPDGSPG